MKNIFVNKKRKIISSFGFVFFSIFMFVFVPHFYVNETTNNMEIYKYASNTSNSNALQNSFIETLSTERASSDFVYLSDIPYDNKQSKSGWGNLLKDQASNGSKITIRYENGTWTFDKGMWAHATSTLVYDLTNYSEYDYFTSFVGLNTTAASSSNGVIFTISTSTDGITWKEEYKSDVKKSNTNADFVKIPIKNANYLKLYADENKGNGNDHSVYADAKLIKANYKEYDVEVKTVEEYDQEIQTKYANQDPTQNADYEKLLLQRNLVNEMGSYTLKRFLGESQANVETYKWLTENLENLRMYTIGGRPDGSYYNSLTVLTELLNARLKDGSLLKNDFNNTNPTKYGTTTMGMLYKKMAITLSLTHSTLVGLWMNPNVPENQSNAVTRYEIYKSLYNTGHFVVSDRQDHTGWFERLEIEEMRYVMNNIIDDEEILWLNEYTQKYIDEHPGKEEEYLQPHHYMKYIWPDYSKPEYYDPNMLSHWDEMYGNFNSKYGITYKTGVQKLWMNLDNGAVCGGISKIGSNIRGVHGTPSSVINQPGHAAIIYYRENANGDGYWTLDNDVSGWPNSNKTEKLLVRMPLGWGDESYLKTTAFSEGVVNYVLLAQAALNDFTNYQKSREIYLQADVYKDDLNKQLEIYEKAIDALPINIDAWYGIIETYKEMGKSKQEFLDLALRMFEALKYYPLPMYHLGEEIEDALKTEDNKYTYQFIQARTKYLTNATTVTNAQHIQSNAIVAEAKYLLNNVDNTLATFSFDGENANTIVLSERYNGNGVRWDYCLAGSDCLGTGTSTTAPNNNWKTVSAYNYIKLTDAELAKITEDNDIYVHIVGVNYSTDNVFKIDIQKPAALQLYNNDLENRVIGATTEMEWRMVSGENTYGSWTSFVDASPNLTGDKTVQVRKKATGTFLTSDIVELSYTEDDLTDPTKVYIPVSHLSVDSFSTEAPAHGRYASYAIDGNLYTSWHSNWNGNDNEKYIVIKLNRSFYLSALDYVPIPQNNNGGNGLIKSAKIEVSMTGKDGEWITVTESTPWSSGYKDQNVWRTYEFEQSIEAQYIKITGLSTNNNFITAAMFNLYQDTTKKQAPAVQVAYSTELPTNEDVIARLVNLDENTIEVTGICESVVDGVGINCTTEDKDNDNDLLTYTFTENGSIYFQYKRKSNTDDATQDTTTKQSVVVDENLNYKEAKVTWIDKVAPEAYVTYSKIEPTNQDVTVTIYPNETVRHLNGTPIDENGNPIVIVPTVQNNDEEDNPELEYAIYNPETGMYRHTYTFTENGSFTFEFEDLAGNRGTYTVTVNNIDKKVPFASISYSETTTTSNPVTVTLIPEPGDKITILNNNGKNQYTFTKNGEFEFLFQDEAGNTNNAIASVDWIVEKPQQDDNNNNNNQNNGNNTNNNTGSTNQSNGNTTNKPTNSNNGTQHSTNNSAHVNSNTGANNNTTTGGNHSNTKVDEDIVKYEPIVIEEYLNSENNNESTSNKEESVLEKETNSQEEIDEQNNKKKMAAAVIGCASCIILVSIIRFVIKRNK